MGDITNVAKMSNFRVCADCALLTDDSAAPHGLLVAIAGSETPGKMRYRCLVCSTHHVLDTLGPRRNATPTSWFAGAGRRLP